MPGQEHEHVAGLLASAPAARPRRSPARSRVPFIIGSQRTSTGNDRPTLSIDRCIAEHVRGSLATSGVADIASRRRSGRTVARASRANARPRSVGTLRSCTSSKITSPTPGSSGSCCSRRVRTPSVTTSIRVSRPDAALVAGLVADESADLGRRAARPSAGPRRGWRAGAARASRCAAVEPRLVEQPQRRDGRLAGAGRGDEQRRTVRRRARSPGRRRTSTTGRSSSCCRQRHGSAECWRAVERPRIAGHRDGRADPRRRRGDLLGHRAPLPRRPSPRRTACSVPSRRMNTNAGSWASPSAAHERPVGVAVHEELVGQRAEERLGAVGVRGDDEVDPGVGAAEALEDPRRRLQHPRALVGVRDRAPRWPGGTWSATPRAGVSRRRAGSAWYRGPGCSPRRADGSAPAPHAPMWQ